MKKEQLQFNKRAVGYGPAVVSTYAPGDIICTDIEIGNYVSLETNDVTVIATITDITGTNYKGIIKSFEDISDESYKGHVEGDSIDFEYDEIFGCIR